MPLPCYTWLHNIVKVCLTILVDNIVYSKRWSSLCKWFSNRFVESLQWNIKIMDSQVIAHIYRIPTVKYSSWHSSRRLRREEVYGFGNSMPPTESVVVIVITRSLTWECLFQWIYALTQWLTRWHITNVAGIQSLASARKMVRGQEVGQVGFLWVPRCQPTEATETPRSARARTDFTSCYKLF